MKKILSNIFIALFLITLGVGLIVPFIIGFTGLKLGLIKQDQFEKPAVFDFKFSKN